MAFAEVAVMTIYFELVFAKAFNIIEPLVILKTDFAIKLSENKLVTVFEFN